MNPFSRPRHPYISNALTLARTLCAGQIIDDAPALRHAVAVAKTVARHDPDAAPELIAAALLHDAVEFAPAAGIDDAHLDEVLDDAAPGAATVVRSLTAQHRAMEDGQLPTLAVMAELTDSGITLIAAADKTVAFRSLMTRARRSGSPAAFWAARSGLRDLLPYFHRWIRLADAAGALPPTLTGDLRRALDDLETAILSA